MGTFNYFGYASNLKQSLLEKRIGGHHVLNATVGRLIDYGLYFNHRQSDGQARANIVAKKGEQVFGVIYVIDEKHYEALFKTEPGYQLIHVEVEIDSDNTVVEA